MADPAIQTFCCHRPNRSDYPVHVLMEFHSDFYNSVCVFSSLLGIFGAVYQILPRRHTNGLQRSYGISIARSRRTVLWLAVADLMASVGVFVRSILWICIKDFIPAANDSLSNVVFCAISSAWIQFFYTATWFWTLCYALDVRQMFQSQREFTEHTICYHITAWVSPALLTSMGLLILYVPNANCHDIDTLSGILTHILPNYFATFLPVAAIMIINPILYCCSTRDARFLISIRLGQYTQRERKAVDGIKTKFLFIILTFYICWLPNLIFGVLIWSLWIHMSESVIIFLWYSMAVMNPLQALLNMMVYRRWSGTAEHVYLPCLPCEDSSHLSEYSPIHPVRHVAPLQGEDTPLLRSHEENGRMSINDTLTNS